MNISVVACQLEECRLDGSTFFLDMITWELSCWGFAKMLERLDDLAAVIDHWSCLLVVNEWNAAWTVELSSFCVSVSHYKISCHPIILIWQSVLVWFIYFFFWFRVFFWPPKNWDKNKLLEMVPSQLEKYQTVTESESIYLSWSHSRVGPVSRFLLVWIHL